MHYTENYIKEEFDVDEVLKKWIILKNEEHIKRQRDAAIRFYFHPFNDGKKKFHFEELPFPSLKKEEVKFDRKKAWKEAPEYDLDKLAGVLGGL